MPPVDAWSLAGFDAALVAQTYPGRPMTTHHVLELEAVVSIDRWRSAAVAWVAHFPELRSVVEFAPRLRRTVVKVEPADIHARVESDDDASEEAIERWINRSIDLWTPCPFRLRIAPGLVAAQSVTLSLHHSVTDGSGALMLFDALLELVQGHALPARSQRRPSAAVAVPWRALWRRVAALSRPRAAMQDIVDTDATGHRVLVQTLDAGCWRALTERAHACGVTRNTLLWHTAAQTTAAMPKLADADEPIRVLAAVDLRAAFGVADDMLGNWLGTIEHDLDGDDSDAGLRRLHAALREQRDPALARATPVVLGALVEHLPLGLARSLLRWVDSPRWPNTHTILLSHIRPRMPHCWPTALRPRRLWCTSLLPRKPGLGLTVTTMGDAVTIAASWRADALRRASVEDFLSRWTAAMDRPLGHRAASPSPESPASARAARA